MSATLITLSVSISVASDFSVREFPVELDYPSYDLNRLASDFVISENLQSGDRIEISDPMTGDYVNYQVR